MILVPADDWRQHLLATRVAFYISGFDNPSVAIRQLTALSWSLTFLRLYVLRTFWHTRAICVVYSNLQDSSCPKSGFKSWKCLCDYFLQLSMWINSTTVHQWASKIRSRWFETRLWHRGFTRMSPKVNSSRLSGCFKMSQIQQKLLAHEALTSKWSPVFSEKTGHVAIVPLEQRRTVNSDWYTTICLPVILPEIRKTNRRRRITLHHDNASSHTSAQTTGFLSTQNIDLISHSPYSPNLAPNDFFLLPYVKNKMRG